MQGTDVEKDSAATKKDCGLLGPKLSAKANVIGEREAG